MPETPVTEETGDGEPPADTTATLPQTTPAASSTQPAREPSGDPAGRPAAQADDGVYQLTEDTYDTVLQQAQTDEHQDIVLELTEDIAQNAAGETIRFTGIPGKAVTLRSAGDAVYSIRLGSELQGALNAGYSDPSRRFHAVCQRSCICNDRQLYRPHRHAVRRRL